MTTSQNVCSRNVANSKGLGIHAFLMIARYSAFENLAIIELRILALRVAKKNMLGFLFRSTSSLGATLREVFREGYGTADLLADIRAGFAVSLIAIPLAMALSVAVDVPPHQGLYTIVVAGTIAALFGGSRFQITGPTASFVAVLIPTVQRHGLSGLAIATMMAGLLLISFSLLRLGRVIKIVPHPVVTGFTSASALVIVTLQLKDFFGLTITNLPDHYLLRLFEMAKAFPSVRWIELLIASVTLLIIVTLNKRVRKIPAPFVALVIITALTQALSYWLPEIGIDTLASRFVSEIRGKTIHGIPQGLPDFILPWNWGDGKTLSLDLLAELFPIAFTIAILCAIESLMSAVAADSMTQTTHNPNVELFAQGAGNFFAPFFGGTPATGAIARTAANIRFGARSPVSGIVQSIVVVSCLLFAAPVASMIPMAALAAILVMVAWNMADPAHFRHILQAGTKEDKIVLIICFTLTVVVDMSAGVIGGVLLSMLLFMNRMAKLTSGTLFKEIKASDGELKSLPKEILVYRISGPMFFGTAQRAMASLSRVTQEVKIVIFDISIMVSIMDITGWTALESSLARLHKTGIQFYFCGVDATLAKQLKAFAAEKFSAQNIPIFISTEEAIETALKTVSSTTA